MGSGWNIVHVSLSYRTVTDSFFEQCDGLLRRGHILFSNILHIKSLRLVFSNPDIGLARIEKILNLLQIDLHHADLDPEFDMRRWLRNSGENCINHSGQNTHLLLILIIGANTSMGLTRRCLAIGEYSSIKPLKSIFHNIMADFRKYLLLSRSGTIYVVKWEFVVALFLPHIDRSLIVIFWAYASASSC